MVIDEIQLVPELLAPIKVSVDLDPTPGRYLLTGSSRILAMRTLPDALPGRMEVIDSSQLRRRDYLERLVVGGFPEASAEATCSN